MFTDSGRIHNYHELYTCGPIELFRSFYIGSPRCAMLSWGADLEEFYQEHGDFDVIIGADVVFWPNAVPLLMETVSFFIDKNVS